MIGYMKPIKKRLSKADRDIYQSIYCGLCRCLKYEYGFTGIATLNYEVTNTLLLIGAMNPNPYPQMVMSCSITPFYWRPMMGVNQNAFHAAAAVTIIAAAMETEDNLHDCNKWYNKLIYTLISPKAEKALLQYREEIEQIKESYKSFMRLERRAANRSPDVTFQMLTEASGEIIARAACIIGTHAGCQQMKELYDAMYLWGEWIYLVDAIDDYAQDRETGQFNPLFLPDKPTSVSALLRQIEQQANFIIDAMVLRNSESLVYELFHNQIPYRSGKVLEKARMSETEEKYHESSVQCEN